ncbi:hypothetical protein TNCV_3093411 [Trichonephila clavipes]|nr:hypothetical protein TNCV_3093411 [Trichonephila clavipes]
MSSRRTSRASQLSTARSLGMSESLAPEAAQRIRNRTSLVGLALDSATSSGLGRAPRSAMQDPIRAPPGTTRQIPVSQVPRPPVQIPHVPEPVQIPPEPPVQIPEPVRIPPDLDTLEIDPLEPKDALDLLMSFVFEPPDQDLQLLHTVSSIFDGDLISFLDEFERDLAPMDLIMPRMSPCVKKIYRI